MEEKDLIALQADVTVLRAAVLGLLAASPAKQDIIKILRAEGQQAIDMLQKSGVRDVSESALMQARAKLLLMIEGRPPR